MRVRWVAVIVVVIAMVFALGGLGAGYVLWHEGQSETADCMVARRDLENLSLLYPPSSPIKPITDLANFYDQNCR